MTILKTNFLKTTAAAAALILLSQYAIAQTSMDDHAAMKPSAEQSQMDHSNIDHSDMDHSDMNHADMDHSDMNHADMDHSNMDHGDMTDDAMDAMDAMDHSTMSHDDHNHDHPEMDEEVMADEIPAQGASVIVAEVNGLVCDFCAQALKKVFKKEDAVDFIHVDLDAGEVRITLNDGQDLADERVEKLIRKSGYSLVGTSRKTAQQNAE